MKKRIFIGIKLPEDLGKSIALWRRKYAGQVNVRWIQKRYLHVTLTPPWYEENVVKISIKDTGTGMTDEVKHKIFEPFFTTKEVGEGTGLGLSIVFSIIEKHKGHIDVLSEVDQGTEFIITLPVNTK